MNNRGSVLIFVLMFVAFAVGMVLTMHEFAGEALTDSSYLQDDYQSSIFAMTAIEVLRKILEDDDNNYDADNEDWALIPAIPIPGGYVSISITPLNGRIPLNYLAKDDNVSSVYLEACNKVITELEIEDAICPIIKDWVDEDSEPVNMGEEDYEYLMNGKEYSTKNGELETLRELTFVDLVKDHYNELTPFFTTEGDGKLNLNFVPREDLVALLPDLEPYADEIIDYRRQNTYKNISNLLDAASIPEGIYNNSLDYLTVKSSLFYIKTEVTLNEISRYYHVLLQRENKSTRILKYIEGNDGIFF
jgi:general secretion pathway protein K